MRRRAMMLALVICASGVVGPGCKQQTKAKTEPEPETASAAKGSAGRGTNSDLPFYTPKIQLLPEHIREVVKALKQFDKPKLLVWGVGYDSRMWCELNKQGTTYFVEDNCKWAMMTTPQVPCRVILAKYDTRIADADKLLVNPRLLRLELPPDILATKFDVLVVDAPDGSHPGAPGRMKSIYMSSVLCHERSHVFVDDFKRPVEQTFGEEFLGKKFGPPRVHEGRGKLAHYAKGIGPE